MEEQARSSAEWCYIDNNFPLPQTIKKKMTTRNDKVYLLFVDLSKAYHTVPINELKEIQVKNPINVTIIKVKKELYENRPSTIKVGQTITERFPVTKDLR